MSLNFGLGDVEHLRLGDLADLVGLGVGRPLGDLRRLLEQHGSRRALGDELERAVAVDRDDDGNRRPLHLFRAVVELHHELADVDAVRTQRSSDRRGRRRLPPRDLNLDLCRDLLCHRACLSPTADSIPSLEIRPAAAANCQRRPTYTVSTCQYSNSTGVERPKISISTLTRPLASSTVSTVPSKLSNVPSLIFTRSPGAKSILIFGCVTFFFGRFQPEHPLNFVVLHRNRLAGRPREVSHAARLPHEKPASRRSESSAP